MFKDGILSESSFKLPRRSCDKGWRPVGPGAAGWPVWEGAGQWGPSQVGHLSASTTLSQALRRGTGMQLWDRLLVQDKERLGKQLKLRAEKEEKEKLKEEAKRAKEEARKKKEEEKELKEKERREKREKDEKEKAEKQRLKEERRKERQEALECVRSQRAGSGAVDRKSVV